MTYYTTQNINKKLKDFGSLFTSKLLLLSSGVWGTDYFSVNVLLKLKVSGLTDRIITSQKMQRRNN
jgi:hypothetical protein